MARMQVTMAFPTCDMCHRPATCFYHYASCTAGGGPAEVSRQPASLCAEHAALHEQDECKRLLAEMPKHFEKFAKLDAQEVRVNLTFSAEDEMSARSLEKEIVQLCGGEASVFSPAVRADRLRQIRPQGFGINVPEIPVSHLGWLITWQSDPTVSVMDRWQTEGWSHRLHVMATVHKCKLSGWGVDRRRQL